ncbi:MAG: ArsA family ATPase [Deltaproteobacteria bacterium]|nr:ArsA family ATPase [Deltaproteobacteria bacterium]
MATKIEMFTGKGGVGKTTMSVAGALYHSRFGRTLLISTDPSGSLSEIFSRPLDQRVTEVDENLEVVELTRRLVLDLWRKKFADEIYTVLSSFLPVGREIIDYIEGAPGIDEEFMLDYLLTAARSGRYETIVWDTAPTVTTLNLLFVQRLFYSHLTQAQKVYIKVKNVFSRVDPLALINQWLELTAAIIELLKTDTRSWVVANPERLPVEQALDIAASLADFGIGINGFILNKLLPGEVCAGSSFWEEKYSRQQDWRECLRQRAAYPVREIPDLAGELSTPESLATVTSLLYQSE